MNEKLIKEIRNRVDQVNARRVDESVLAAHIDAIAEVYDTDRETVESIAKEVIAENHLKGEGLDFDKLRNTLWISALVLVIISVIWLLYNNLQNEPESDDLSKANQRTAEYVKEALVSLNVVKISIAENFQATGQYASSFEQIGIRESDMVLTKYIGRIQLDQEGAITANLSALIDNHKYVKLIPTLRTGSYQLEWDCRSNLDQLVLDHIEGCTAE